MGVNPNSIFILNVIGIDILNYILHHIDEFKSIDLEVAISVRDYAKE